MLELPFKWSASFVVDNTRVTVDVESDTLNQPEQRYLSFTGVMEGGGQIVMTLAPMVADMAGAEDVRELCAAWDRLHMVRFADMTPEQETEVAALETLLVLINGERYGAPGSLEDIEDAEFSNTSDVFDSRDVIKRIETLAGAFEAAGLDPAKLDPSSPDYDAQGLEEGETYAHDLAAELKALRDLESEAKDCGDWQYGATLVRGDFFEDFAREEAESIGAIDKNAHWPLQFIDWPAAAEALKADYTEVDFDGATFFVRS